VRLGFLRTLLAPLGALWGALAALRSAAWRLGLLRPARLAGPVISVGNLGVGGSGKTPVVARLAELLRDQGLPVAILSRGYGGSFRGEALVVSDGQSLLADAATAGDEPVMLARALPGVVVAVGPRRDRVGRAVEARFGRRVHLLDDGFQHLRLARDLDLLCLGDGDLADRPLPAGRLREFASAAERADLLLFTGGEPVPAGAPDVFRVRRRVVGFFGPDAAPRPAPRRPFLLAAIARPERFHDDVRGLVPAVAGSRCFRDHHAFSADELATVAAEARAAGADTVVTTEKDAVRIASWPGEGPPLLVLRIAAELEDEARLRERLLSVARGEARPPRRAQHAAEALAASAVAAVLRRLPRGAALATGRFLGRLLGDLDRRHVAIASENLRHAFPHWDEARRLRTARGVYAHFGQVMLDLLWLDGRPREQVLPLVEVVGWENFEAALAQAGGRGILLPTAHIGNWEIHGISHAWLHAPVGVVARVLDNPLLDRRLRACRSMTGNVVIYKQRALAQILRLLREGKGVAILVDQNVQEKDGIFVEFFGRPAATTPVVGALAVKTGCAVVPGRTELRPDGRYRLSYGPPLAWTPSGDRQADIAAVTQAVTRCIEAWVRETPEQWLWIHRRWKTRPPGEDAA
jgi:tetraacyldisaccharide 4'-kinase